MRKAIMAPRKALITGAARRIGRATAEMLGRDGYQLALHSSARSADETRAVAQMLAGKGVRASVHIADLTQPEAVRALFAEAARDGAIDLLINNASLFEPDGAHDFTDAGMMQHWAANLHAPCLLAQALANQPQLEAGLVVNIIDQRVWRLNPEYFSYTLAKSALWTATRTMAQAFAPKVRVNGIGPGPVLANKRQAPEDFAREAAATLLGREVGLDDITGAIAYLIGASRVTGQMIAVDSGQHLAWKTADMV
ncbi:MAG: SDR family oxidoreductase [Hyphomicrobiales bacterium]|nr:SDR family oxidoreductase [Hyphomicrobiales bacterium]